MKYSVINSRVTPPAVLMSFPFQWMAAAVAGARGGEKCGFDVGITPTDAQDFINICTHRDQLGEQLQEAVDHLLSLVARGDDGKWITLFPEEYLLGDESQELLDRLTAA